MNKYLNLTHDVKNIVAVYTLPKVKSIKRKRRKCISFFKYIGKMDEIKTKNNSTQWKWKSKKNCNYNIIRYVRIHNLI